VLDFVGDRRAVDAAQFADDVGQRVALDLRAQDRSRYRLHDRRRQAVVVPVERGIALGLRAERIEHRC
jgi:hypothetical protein